MAKADSIGWWMMNGERDTVIWHLTSPLLSQVAAPLYERDWSTYSYPYPLGEKDYLYCQVMNVDIKIQIIQDSVIKSNVYKEML